MFIIVSIQNQSNAASLVKVLWGQFRLSIIQHDGEYTWSTEETFELLLLKEHFPGFVKQKRPLMNCWCLKATGLVFDRENINPKGMKWAISSFQSLKTPGPNDVYPTRLQKGLKIILGTKLLRASMVQRTILKIRIQNHLLTEILADRTRQTRGLQTQHPSS